MRGLFWCPRKYRDLLLVKVEEIRTRKNIDGGPQITLIEEFDEEMYIRPTLIESNDFMMPF